MRDTHLLSIFPIPDQEDIRVTCIALAESTATPSGPIMVSPRDLIDLLRATSLRSFSDQILGAVIDGNILHFAIDDTDTEALGFKLP